jgi:two-component system phosphate regulon sensor histidine kinase PhoR
MFRSIQWRITLSFSLLIVIVMTSLGFIMTNYIRNNQMENLRGELKYESGIIAENISKYFEEDSQYEDLINDIREISHIIDTRVTIIDPNGNVLADSLEEAASMENHASRPEFKEAISEGYGESSRYSTTLGYSMMYIAVPIPSQGDALGVIRLSLPLKDIDDTVGSIRNSIIFAVLIAIVFFIISAWLIARILVSPIKQVTEASRKIASGEIYQKIDISTADETGELARAFNQMSVKLASMMETISEDRGRLSGILDNIADGVIMTDTEGRIVLANRAVEKIFRIKTAGSTGMHLIAILHKHDLSDLLKECLDTGHEKVSQFESDLYKRFLRVMAVPLNGRKTRGVLFLIQDLTDLRSFQTMRRELIGNISHDFRTPLAGIKAMVETLQDGAIDDREAAQDFLSRIDDEVNRLAQIGTGED